MEGFFLFLSRVADALNIDGIFFLCSIIATVCLTLFLSFALSKRKVKTVGVVCIFIVLGCFFFSLSLLIVNPKFSVSDLLVVVSSILAVYLFLSIPAVITLGVKPKTAKAKKEEKTVSKGDGYAFLRTLEQNLRESNYEISQERAQQPKVLKCVEEKEDERISINFSHVKNVIARLNGYELSSPDRRAVRELETAVYDAERNTGGEETKIKLNEGLNALLKIMAKYGV